jgi:hypothetical protein
MSSWHTPERKVEQALKTYLQTVAGTEFDGVQIVTRFSNLALTEPRIEIVCEELAPWPDVEELEHDTGNWRCSVNISVVSHYDKDVDAEAHDELAGQVMDKLIISDGSSDALTAEIGKTQIDSDITIFDVWRGERKNSVEGHTLKTEQSMVLLMAPSKL